LELFRAENRHAGNVITIWKNRIKQHFSKIVWFLEDSCAELCENFGKNADEIWDKQIRFCAKKGLVTFDEKALNNPKLKKSLKEIGDGINEILKKLPSELTLPNKMERIKKYLDNYFRSLDPDARERLKQEILNIPLSDRPPCQTGGDLIQMLPNYLQSEEFEKQIDETIRKLPGWKEMQGIASSGRDPYPMAGKREISVSLRSDFNDAL
jgi:hypothetical protein